METKDFIAIGAAVIALTSAFFASRNVQLTALRRRVDVRNQFQSYMLAINKALLDDPDLFAIYDAHPRANDVRKKAENHGKLISFAYMLLNTFEVVFVHYLDMEFVGKEGVASDSPYDVSDVDLASFRAWENYFVGSVQNSCFVRAIFDEELAADKRSAYNRLALQHMNKLRTAAKNPRPVPDYAAWKESDRVLAALNTAGNSRPKA